MATKERQKAARKHLQTCIPIHTLSWEEARVAIAKDVLAALDIKVLTPNSTYFSARFPRVVRARTSLRELLPKASKITVCAIGAVFAAYVGRWNRFSVPDPLGHDGDLEGYLEGYYVDLARFQLSNAVGAFFTSDELDMLESGFGDRTSCRAYYSFFFDAVCGYRYQSSSSPSMSVSEMALRNMMKAIIAEKGKPLPMNPWLLAWVNTEEGRAYIRKYNPEKGWA